MQAVGGLVVGLGGELVEGLVFVLGDVGLVLQPQRLDLVDPLVFEQDREADEVAVGGDEVLETVFLGVFGELRLQLQDDLHAARNAVAFLDRVAAHTIAGPDERLALMTPAAGVDLDLIGHHEGRVEADAELADHVARRAAAFLHRLEEGLRAGVGDGAKVLDQLLAGHADAVILDREGPGLLVGGDPDFQRQLGIGDVLLGALQVAEFFQRVGGIRHQLAEENLAVRVEGVDDKIEQLTDLRLERVLFECGFAHGMKGL